MKFVFEPSGDLEQPPFMVAWFDPYADEGKGASKVSCFHDYVQAVKYRLEHDKQGDVTKLWVDGDALVVE